MPKDTKFKLTVIGLVIPGYPGSYCSGCLDNSIKTVEIGGWHPLISKLNQCLLLIL